jgi:hypothetical protein
VKDKIGFVCVGQAGGNIGQILEQHGYNCLFINTSKEDLSTLNTNFRFHIPGGEGCNHSRDKAIELVKKNYRQILEEINDKLCDQQLIYFVFSAGGGTGSGAAPVLIEISNSHFPNKHFGCITILPSFDETTKAHMNAYQCYQELSSIEKLATVFTLDNNKIDKFIINGTFVSLLNTVFDIPNHVNIRGNIDKAELWELLTTRGNCIITTCQSNVQNNLVSAIIKSWELNIFADIEKDKNIVYLGLSLTDEINVDDLKKYIGTPFDVFKNYNRDQTVSILSGLTFPKTRINKIIDILNDNKNTIQNNLLNAKTNKITETLDWFNDLNSNKQPFLQDEITNIESIFAKYVLK